MSIIIIANNMTVCLGQNFNAWSSASLQPYFAITANWAYCDTDGSMKIQAHLIVFHRIFGHHTGKKMAQLCIDLLDRAGTTSNVRSLL
jgi:hypothetical protein